MGAWTTIVLTQDFDPNQTLMEEQLRFTQTTKFNQWESFIWFWPTWTYLTQIIQIIHSIRHHGINILNIKYKYKNTQYKNKIKQNF